MFAIMISQNSSSKCFSLCSRCCTRVRRRRLPRRQRASRPPGGSSTRAVSSPKIWLETRRPGVTGGASLSSEASDPTTSKSSKCWSTLRSSQCRSPKPIWAARRMSAELFDLLCQHRKQHGLCGLADIVQKIQPQNHGPSHTPHG